MPSSHIVLTSHRRAGAGLHIPIRWNGASPKERGPVVGSVGNPVNRNVIGTHSGSYSVYRAISVASGRLDPARRPDLTDTTPVASIGPYPQWTEKGRIVSLDPYGHMVTELFADELKAGVDVRPTIAITRARLTLPEIREAIAAGRLAPDGDVLLASGEAVVTKIAVDPVWHLPGIAERFRVEQHVLRRVLFEQTGGMYPELVTRSDLEVFLPPVGGTTVYIFGDVAAVADPERPLAARVHDECNGSDVFGSDICTCRPYLTHGVELCIETAQKGGAGVVVYNRKEGRALGEVTKFLVYNARKRQQGGDTAATYFARTECVAGVQDARFQELMPDVLHWLGVRRIDRWASMSDLKYDALVGQGIEVRERVSLPPELIPEDAHVEIEAKKAAGYFSTDVYESGGKPGSVTGRDPE